MWPTAQEAVKKSTISRKDAKTQRLAKKNCLVFFAPSTTLSVNRRMKCLSFSANYFTRSKPWVAQHRVEREPAAAGDIRIPLGPS
jgi:hypothetical protein